MGECRREKDNKNTCFSIFERHAILLIWQNINNLRQLLTTRLFWLCLFLPLLTSCQSVIPGNYLSPSSISEPQKVNKQWVRVKVVKVDLQSMTTEQGKKLLSPLMQVKPYKIGAFDKLHIIVWGHPEVSTLSTTSLRGEKPLGIGATNPTILVQSDGYIYFPYVGRLKVSGLTIEQVQSAVSSRISNYIRQPQVTVQIAHFRNRHIYVLGEVMNPRILPLTDKPLTMMEALTYSGGINPTYSDPSHVYLIRGDFTNPSVYLVDATTPQSLMIAEKIPLQENDIVYVSSAGLSGWNRMLNQILPSISTFLIARNLTP